MKYSFITFIILFLLFGIYLYSVDNIITLSVIGNNNTEDVPVPAQRINIGEKIDVVIKRPRWYGHYEVSSLQESLYLFNFIKVPIKKGSFNFIYFHLIVIFIFGMIQLSVIILEFFLNKEKKEKNINFEQKFRKGKVYKYL